MSKFVLTTASPTSADFVLDKKITGIAQVSGVGTYGGAALKMEVAQEGLAPKVVLSDFSMTSDDTLLVNMDNATTFSFKLDPVGTGASVEVSII